MESDLGVRHYWLVWAQPEEILAVRDLFEEWILVGALRSAPIELLAQGHSASPERRALAVRRRRPRPAGRHSLSDCVAGIRQALHPQLRLVWLLLLVEGFPQDAALELTRLLAPSRDQDLRAACAWGLSLLGRGVLIDLRESFAHATAPVRDFFCQTLWHLGPEARGCEVWLEDYDSHWSRAVFYRLEASGWRVLLKRRAWPLWIGQDTLASLAELAFSLEPADRWYALRALLGWGPAHPQAESLLKALAHDPNQDLSEGAVLVAGHLGWLPGPPCSRNDLAAKLHFQEPNAFASGPSIQRQQELLASFNFLEPEEQLECLQTLRLDGIADQKSAEKLWEIIEFPHTPTWRLAAMQAYVAIGSHPHRLARFLSDPNARIREAAAEIVVKVAHPNYILEHLERPEILSALARESHLLRALVDWPPAKFQQLEEKLRSLGRENLLGLLDLGVVRWSAFDQFTPVQLTVATALLRRHQRLPAELVEEVACGRVSSLNVLGFWEDFPPEQHRCRGLAQLLVRAASADQAAARLAVAKRGELGALALAQLLQDADLPIAERAARELEMWPRANHWARPAWLESCPHPTVVSILADWLAPNFLPPYQPLQREWARVLLPRLFNTQLSPVGPVSLDELNKWAMKQSDLGSAALAWSMRCRLS